MDASVAQVEAISLKSYTYKVGAAGALLGGVFVIGSLFVSRDMLSSNTEWHLFGPGDPFVVPTLLIQLVWWACFIMGAGAIVLSGMPAQEIMLERDAVLVPNLFTRKYAKALWSDVLRVDVQSHALFINTRTSPLHIAKLGLSHTDWEDLKRELAARVPLVNAAGA